MDLACTVVPNNLSVNDGFNTEDTGVITMGMMLGTIGSIAREGMKGRINDKEPAARIK